MLHVPIQICCVKKNKMKTTVFSCYNNDLLIYFYKLISLTFLSLFSYVLVTEMLKVGRCPPSVFNYLYTGGNRKFCNDFLATKIFFMN